MNITIILGVSVILQFAVVGVALSLAKKTGARRAWYAIAVAVLFMAVPRSITFVRLMTGEIATPPNLEAELVALDISLLMGIGLIWIGQLFRSFKQSYDLLLKSQKSLLESENRLKILFEYAPDAIFMFDLNGTFIDMNRAAEKLTGYRRTELIGTSIEEIELVSLENVKRLTRSLAQNAKGKPTGPDEYVLNHRNGISVTMEIRAFPVKVRDESLVLGIARDITDRKRIEEVKKRLEAQLRNNQKLETIGTLAGGIAHDFNNILTPIIGFSSMAIEDMPSDGPARTNLDHVIQAAQRAKELVQQILMFSRQADQDRKPVKIHFIVSEALKLLRASLPTTIEIRANINSKHYAVLADPTQIHQVLMNLCTNAYHAMHDNGGVLEVSLDAIEADAELVQNHSNLREGKYVRLTVSDTGHGMDRMTTERIFEPFFTTKGIGEGTGLGLSVVHGIVVNHGGDITVQSEPKKGSTFRVYLPAVDIDTQQEVKANHVIPKGNERVLFVDDEEEITSMGKQMLERFGYKITAKTSSIEALDLFQAYPDNFDVVITDQTMPNLTGDRLAREIKKIRADIPIILITGFSDKITPENYEKFGICEFVMKPLVAHELGNAIRKALYEKEKVTTWDIPLIPLKNCDFQT